MVSLSPPKRSCSWSSPAWPFGEAEDEEDGARKKVEEGVAESTLFNDGDDDGGGGGEVWPKGEAEERAPECGE